jgi:two-component system nitrate/nitrite response regulator NarL
MIRVFVADDHRLFRQALISLLSEIPDLEVVGDAANGRAAVDEILELAPDVVLMDIHMPGLSGTEAARTVSEARPDVAVIVLTVSETDEDLLDAVRAGARGYLLKNADAEELVEAIRRVRAGEAIVTPAMTGKLLAGFRDADRRALPAVEDVLTPRERQVLAHLSTGATNREIATALVISEHTVKTHVRHILRKLEVANRAEAAAYATRHGLAPHDQED